MAIVHANSDMRVLEEASITFSFETKDRFPTLKDLTSAAEDLSEVVTAVAAEMDLSLRDARNWAVNGLKVGSAVLTIAPVVPVEEMDVARDAVGTILNGLRLLEEGTDKRPTYFNDAGLESARHLVGLLNNGITRILVRGPDHQFELSQRVQASVDALTRGVTEVLGSVEGRLEGINAHEGRQFIIYQSGTGKRVVCRYPSEMTRQVLENFEKRVQVTGLIRYTRRGEPAQITVQRVRRLRDRSELPRIADLAGIDPDFTGGQSPEDYLEQLRGGT